MLVGGSLAEPAQKYFVLANFDKIVKRCSPFLPVQVAEKLSDILRDQFEGKIFPENPTPENIEDSVGQPLFVIFRTLCEINEIDPNR